MRSGYAFLMAFCLLTGACSRSAPAGTPAGTAVMPTPAEEGPPASPAPGAVRIEVTPPAGWEPVAGSVIPVQYLKGTASFMIKTENFEQETIDEAVSAAADIFRKSFEDYQQNGEIEPLTVDGKDARMLQFTCTVSGIAMKFRYIYLHAADQVYAITFADTAADFDSLESDYAEIADGIRFVTE